MAVHRIPINFRGEPIGIANIDESGIVTFILPPGSEVFGRKLEELVRAGAVTSLDIAFSVMLKKVPEKQQESSLDMHMPDDRVWRDRVNPNHKAQRY